MFTGLQCFLPLTQGVSAQGKCACPSRHSLMSQHMEKGSVFWVQQQGHLKLIVIALYPSQPSKKHRQIPEERQGGTMAGDTAQEWWEFLGHMGNMGIPRPTWAETFMPDENKKGCCPAPHWDDPEEVEIIRKKFWPVRVVRTWHRLPEKLQLLHPGSVQSQVRWGLDQPGLVESVPARGRGVGMREVQSGERRKNKIPVRIINHWSVLSSYAMESLNLDVFKTWGATTQSTTVTSPSRNVL